MFQYFVLYSTFLTVVHRRLSYDLSIKVDLQHSTMTPVLPFDIFTLIIDIVGENKDTDLLKELSLVSYSFLQICSKHLFSTVELHGAAPKHYIDTSNKGFVKLLRSRPEVVRHIRKLSYKIGLGDNRYPLSQLQPTHRCHPSSDDDDYHLLAPILLKFLRKIPYLNCLTIAAAVRDWNTMDSSLTSALLHLVHLPTINHIEISCIRNFPLSSLTSSINLHRLDIFDMFDAGTGREDGSFEIVQSEMMLREFRTFNSPGLTTKLLHIKMQDGRPAFNCMDLRRLSMSFNQSEDERNIRYILQNAKLLEKLHLSVHFLRSIVGLLSSSVRYALKVLDLTVYLYRFSVYPLSGVCEELEAMAGHNMLESLSFEINVDGHETEDFIGSVIQKVEEILVKPGWSALRQVSFKVSCQTNRANRAKMEALRSLPDEYLSHLPKLESVSFKYSANVCESSQ